jgi:hypothetical protein
MPVDAFISYAHADEAALYRLHKHLAMLRREEKLNAWTDHAILPGDRFGDAIADMLKASSLFLALVSPDYLDSNYCYEREFEYALKLAEGGSLRIIPIILQPCDWRASPLGTYLALPKNGKPVSDWTNENNAFLDVVTNLRRVLKDMDAPQRAERPIGRPPKAERRVRLKQDAVTKWIASAEAAQTAGTIHVSRPLPIELVQARVKFESWWRNAGLRQKRTLAPEVVFKALSLTSRLYRVHEASDELKPNANYWNEQCLDYFEQIQLPEYVVECLIDRAALFLELSQIQHTQPEKFKQVSENGNRVMIRAASLASETQKPEVLRIASRFYYNLARPQKGLLSTAWSNNYLMLSVDCAQRAYDIAPGDIKNMTQLARATQRMAANPPQLNDPAWTKRLSTVCNQMWHTLQQKNDALRTPASYIPPANIAAISSMDVARRLWREAASEAKQSKVDSVMELLRSRALPTQLRAWAIVQDTEWAKDYTFDLTYDLGRIRLVLVAILDDLRDSAADGEFSQAIEDIKVAANVATADQLRSARGAIDTEPSFTGLRSDRLKQLQQIFAVG